MAAVRGGFFGEAGQLPPQELARFVVLAGAAPDAMERLLADTPAPPAEPLAERAPFETGWRRIDLDLAARLGERLAAVSDIPGFRDRMNRAWARVDPPRPPGALLLGGPPTLDIAWITRLLVQQVPLEAVVIATHRPDVTALDWPLRIGVADSAAGRALKQQLDEGRYRDLYTPVIAAYQETMDLLLFPGDLSEALGQQELLEASVVLVLGKPDVDPADLLDALHELSHRHRAAVVAVCDWPVADWADTLFGLVAELSHNVPLPLALFRAGAHRQAPGHPAPSDTPVPVVLGDLAFADNNRPIDAAARLAGQLRDGWPGASLPLDPALLHQLAIADQDPPAETVAAAVEASAGRWPWDMETQGASHLAQLRRHIDAQLGPVDLRRRPWSREAWAMAEPPDMAGPEAAPDSAFEVLPAPRDSPPARHVKFNLRPADRSTPPPEQPRLPPHSEHWLQVFIAPLDHQAHGTAAEPLDERQLDAREEGHWLSVVYCPLSQEQGADGRAAIPSPVTASLHLPRHGPTGTVEFPLRCGEQPAGFRARLIVLHENRVLQTLLLSGQPDGLLSLSVENRYAPGFESPSADTPADLSFVINDSPAGVSGLTTVAPHRASFISPDGLKASIAQMRKILNGAVQAEAGDGRLRLDRAELLDLMRQLANHGAVIVEELAMQHPLQTLDSARRVQVVEAVDQAYFPVEFLYSGPAPEPAAVLCPNAGAALAADGDDIHLQCPHRNDEGHVCPLSFWGFRKCIERHAPNGDPATTVSVPTPGQERLGPFGSALLAASDRAREEMEGPQGLPTVLGQTMADVTTVTTWADWKAQLSSRPRDLLVLMPHSDNSSAFPGIPALEVSRDELAASNLSEKYVHSGAAHGPLVLLLGCSTSFADLPFLNFVRRFHLKGAPVVVGTLSVVHATQARRLAQRLLDTALAPDGQALRLDEALLKVRRGLLAEGNGVAFTLMAYGHSTWRL